MKTTKRDFQIYKEEAEKWIDFFGLKNWCISFSHKKQENLDSENTGWVEVDVESGMACMCLNTIWVDAKEFHNEKEIRLIAFHEVCEIVLAEMDYLARQKLTVDGEIIDKVRHGVIHILENSLFKHGGSVMGS